MPSFAIRVTNEQKKSEKRKKENAGEKGKGKKEEKKRGGETKNGVGGVDGVGGGVCHLTFALQACLLSCLAGFGRTGNTFMLILLLNLYEATAGMFVSFYCAFFLKTVLNCYCIAFNYWCAVLYCFFF